MFLMMHSRLNQAIEMHCPPQKATKISIPIPVGLPPNLDDIKGLSLHLTYKPQEKVLSTKRQQKWFLDMRDMSQRHPYPIILAIHHHRMRY